MATGDLNEYKILELVADHAPIDAFGVGTQLATSIDAPNHGAVYKLVELNDGQTKRYTAKFSEEKHTMPGAKQVFRFPERDIIGHAQDCIQDGAEALLRPVILKGKLVAPPPSATECRAYAASCIDKLPRNLRSLFPCDPPRQVEYGSSLLALLNKVKQEHHQEVS